MKRLLGMVVVRVCSVRAGQIPIARQEVFLEKENGSTQLPQHLPREGSSNDGHLPLNTFFLS